MLIVIFSIGSLPAHAGDLIVAIRDTNGAPVRDAIVTVKLANGEPNTQASPLDKLSINQKDTTYHPFVSLISAGTPVQFVNSDQWGHHVYSFSKAKRFDITVPANTSSKSVTFEKPGIVVIGCNIHDRMLAYIFVNGEGQPAKSDKMGITRFLGLPAGTYSLSAWHPSLRSKRKQPPIDVSIGQEGETTKEITLKLKRPAKKKRKPYKY